MQSKLEQLFSTPPDQNDKFHSNNLKKITRTSEYLIHSLATLGQLLTEMKQGEETPVLRYLVCLNKLAWFARESHSNAPDAPAHFKMTGSPQNQAFCKTAGNLFFSEDYSTLIKINHKSGDFRPSFDSIKWILAILVINETCLPFNLPEVLIIDELDHNGKTIGTHQCSIASIKNWLTTFAENIALTSSLKEQNAETKRVRYALERPRRFAVGDNDDPLIENTKVRRLKFAEDGVPDESNIPALLSSDSPQAATRFPAFGIPSLRLFASSKRPAPLFPEHELNPQQIEKLGIVAPPPLKKRKPERHNFLNSLAQPSESETEEKNSPAFSFI
ncbi:hypothetical protein DGG96_10185 [Legionella qingyii]|uniref:Uncharacterized protein n=1 Tax=Legionella qingyii TaxID=2184757 RepID=A0A317U283_9GAMM|nr:hypothetical protein [Legionella qingyii]PWY55871.1 hypothetical protein DGG96_10185 [Legionella qingyii]RUR23034.1 hypothetical protein ELY20_07785 [Legionella qingyii]RUR26880.1 hypothetical protein ELY16_06490 [Legionella qingyii]